MAHWTDATGLWAACAPRVSACGAFFMSIRTTTAWKDEPGRAPLHALSEAEDRAMAAAIRLAPCGAAIRAAGVRRVVIGMRDPNPLVNGRGVQALREAGIEVVEDVRREECRELNPAYLKFMATGLPWAMLKSMVSLDGRVASDAGESRGLGGEAEQRLCHRLRAEHDAVLVGIGTVLRDDPELTVRLRTGRNPLRVVLDSRLRIPSGSRLVRSAGEAPLLIATVSEDREASLALDGLGARVWRFEADGAGRVPLRALFRRLAEDGRLSLL